MNDPLRHAVRGEIIGGRRGRYRSMCGVTLIGIANGGMDQPFSPKHPRSCGKCKTLVIR
jgi:hypothetical protein